MVVVEGHDVDDGDVHRSRDTPHPFDRGRGGRHHVPLGDDHARDSGVGAGDDVEIRNHVVIGHDDQMTDEIVIDEDHDPVLVGGHRGAGDGGNERWCVERIDTATGDERWAIVG
ncbi:MAG: hypothetical protein ACKODY_08005 [Actinomycetota bacterium]